VLGHRLVIVQDAHLGPDSPEREEAFLAFLEAVPTLGDCLLVNGDLFEFWAEYRRVVPRTGFHVVAELARLRKRIPVVMTGGNHDRWGETFWSRDLGIEFFPYQARLEIGRRGVLALHGDGITERHWGARVLHRVTKLPATVTLFRLLHPDLVFWLTDRLSGALGDTTRDPEVIRQAAELQRQWAIKTLVADPSLGLVVMGHTHRPALAEPEPGRQYLNPGAWLDGYCYAIATEDGAQLCRFAR
jgi:UDP-2,3-diacylglucosamine hydrolase